MKAFLTHFHKRLYSIFQCLYEDSFSLRIEIDELSLKIIKRNFKLSFVSDAVVHRKRYSKSFEREFYDVR